jgi:hypothetical protein
MFDVIDGKKDGPIHSTTSADFAVMPQGLKFDVEMIQFPLPVLDGPASQLILALPLPSPLLVLSYTVHYLQHGHGWYDGLSLF